MRDAGGGWWLVKPLGFETAEALLVVREPGIERGGGGGVLAEIGATGVDEGGDGGRW